MLSSGIKIRLNKYNGIKFGIDLRLPKNTTNQRNMFSSFSIVYIHTHGALYFKKMNLIFVYNASSSSLNRTLDFAHKLFKPKTYECNLCLLTHGNFGEKEEWKKFRDNSNIKMEFMYKDQFEKKYFTTQYPVVLITSGDKLETIISPEEFKKIPNLKSLIKRIESIL